MKSLLKFIEASDSEWKTLFVSFHLSISIGTLKFLECYTLEFSPEILSTVFVEMFVS